MRSLSRTESLPARTRSTSLAFRLAVLHSAVFVVASLVASTVFYLVLASQIQKRTDTALLEQIRECTMLLKTQGIQAVKTEITNAAEAAGTRDVYFRLFDKSGVQISSSGSMDWKELDYDYQKISTAFKDKYVIETDLIPHQGQVRIIYASIGQDAVIQIAQSLRDDERFMKFLQLIFGIAIAVISIVAVFIGWLTARRALLKVSEVTHTAINISNGVTSLRVSEEGRSDEISELRAAFNTMLDRNEALVTGMKEVTDNLAHELRSPITRMRGLAETTLTDSSSTDQTKEVVGVTIENCDRLLNLINATLDVSEAESGAITLSRSQINLDRVISDISELFRCVAEDKQINFNVSLTANVVFVGDLSKVQRCISNLIDNAIKYTPPGGRIKIDLSQSSNNALILIEDTGCGISEADSTKIFQRFYRCDASRSTRGNGLGLSLARALARAHGGDITVRSTLNQGSAFTLTLPLS